MKKRDLLDRFTKLFPTCFTSYCRHETVGSVSAPPQRRKIPSVRLWAQTCCSCNSPTLPVSTSAADSCRGGAGAGACIRSQRSFCEPQVLNYTSLVEEGAPTSPHSPRGLLLSEKDQELFQLPPLLFSMERNFKHRTSEPAAP